MIFLVLALHVKKHAKAKTPPRRGFIKELKRTDKPLSFGYSVVGQSFIAIITGGHKQKPRRGGVFFKKLKLTDKPGSVVGQSFI